MQPDFYSEEQLIVGEIFAHVGKPKKAQDNKVANDILKMLLLEKTTGKQYRKIIVVCDASEKKKLEGKSVLAESIRQFGIEILCVEIDTDMIQILNDRFGNIDNLEIINKDILKVDMEEYLKDSKVKIIANLPYYITSPIIFKLLEYRKNIESITIMIQKEVADRINAKPHSKDYGVLTINTNYIADVVKLFNVPNTSFIPAPNVTSAVIQITPNTEKEKTLGGDIKWH